MTATPERCPRCDRAECPWWSAPDPQSDDDLFAIGPEARDCELHAVPIERWRQRALDAEARAEQARVGMVRADYCEAIRSEAYRYQSEASDAGARADAAEAREAGLRKDLTDARRLGLALVETVDSLNERALEMATALHGVGILTDANLAEMHAAMEARVPAVEHLRAALKEPT